MSLLKSSGAQERQVDEPLESSLFRAEAIIHVELEAFPEPKALLPSDLKALVSKHGNYVAVGRLIGASACFVSQNLKRLT